MLVWRNVDNRLLDKSFERDVVAVLGPSQHTFYVTEGFRSLKRSKELYEDYKAGRGPRAAPPGKSAHNYGLAIDVVLDSSPLPGLQPSWSTKLAGWLWLKWVLTNHPTLKSGWTFNDWPHIERRGWDKATRPVQANLQQVKRKEGS